MPNDNVRALSRALDLLEALRETPLGITELARRCSLSKSTTHRLLGTLQARRYVAQEEDTQRYRLGLSLIGLGSAVATHDALLRSAHQVMREIASVTGESVRLGIAHQDEIIIIYHVQGAKPIRYTGLMGLRLPMHCTAIGKLILADLPTEEAEKIVATKGLHRYGPNSITDLAQLKASLEEARRLGYAVNDEEHSAGGRAVAAPIRDARGRVCAGLAIIGPIDRIAGSSFAEYGRTAIEAADRVSAILGWTGKSG